MTTTWHLSTNNPEAAQAFTELSASYDCAGEPITACPISRVVRTRLGGKDYYVKRYHEAGKHLRKYLGRSRIRGEWENLLLFQKLGIPAPPVIAYGETRLGPCFKRGVLITEGIDAVDLASLAKADSPLLKNRAWVQQVVRQVADYTQRLHAQHFVHHDLKWRNILVTTGETPRVIFIDCPIGRKRSIITRKRFKIKELAELDKFAKRHLDPRERLLFMHCYLGRSHLEPQDKTLIRRLLAFFAAKVD